MTHLRSVPLGLTIALMLGLNVAVCGGGDNSSPSPTATSPTGSPGPTQAGNPIALESARQYLLDTGVDDTKGDLTEPKACSQITDKTEGRFCVHDNFSIYAPGLVILVIGDKENATRDTWEIRLEPSDAGWHVTSAKPFGSRE